MKKTANLLVTAYLLLLFVAYPFYMKEGYVEIGRAKYSFWIRISLSTAAVLLLFFVIRLIRELKEKSLQLQATDISILVFAGTLLLTLALAVDRKEALFGTEGWNMGFALYGVLCLLYLMIRLLWKPVEFTCWGFWTGFPFISSRWKSVTRGFCQLLAILTGLPDIL